MFNEIMGEIKSDNKKKIANQQVTPNVPAYQKQTTVKNKDKKEDDISKMLAELGWYFNTPFT